MFITGSHQNTIGGTTAAAANIISGNGLGGISIAGGGADNNSVTGNFIGTDGTGTVALGNTGNGITIASNNNIIGGTAAGAANVIADNSGAGVSVPSGNNNAIRANSIFANGALGIDLTPSGVNTNTTGSGQNYPVLNTASATGSSVNISGKINSQAYATVIIDFYATPTADSSGHGQGQTYLGSTTVVTDTNGNANFNAGLPVAVPAGSLISATATAGNNNTSEFSADVVLRSGITVTPTSLTTTEAGGTASFTVVLSRKPTASVTITLSSTNPAQGTLSQSSLTFTTGNWNKAQSVTVTGLDDHIVHGDQTYQITGTASSSDSSFNGLTMTPVTVVNEEADVAGVKATTSAPDHLGDGNIGRLQRRSQQRAHCQRDDRAGKQRPRPGEPVAVEPDLHAGQLERGPDRDGYRTRRPHG